MRLHWAYTRLLKCINNWETIWMERNVSTQFMEWSPRLDFALAENYVGNKSQQDAYNAHTRFTHQTTNLLQGCRPCCDVVQIYLLWKLSAYESSHRPNLTEAFWSSFQTWKVTQSYILRNCLVGESAQREGDMKGSERRISALCGLCR